MTASSCGLTSPISSRSATRSVLQSGARPRRSSVPSAPAEGHEFDFSAMFDRVGAAARGREGGGDGAPGAVALDDGTVLRPKGVQHVPAGRRLVLHLPGGGGFGDPAGRSAEARRTDERRGYLGADNQ